MCHHKSRSDGPQTSSNCLGAVELNGLAVVDRVGSDQERQEPRVGAARLVHLGGVDAVPRAVDHRNAAVAHDVAVHRRQRLLALRAQHDPREQPPRQRQQLHDAQAQQLPPAAPLRVALAKVPHRQPHPAKLCAPRPPAPLVANLVPRVLPHLAPLPAVSPVVAVPSTASSTSLWHSFGKQHKQHKQTNPVVHSLCFSQKPRHFPFFLFFLKE